MDEVYIIGARGHGREIAIILDDINIKNKRFLLKGFIDDDPLLFGKSFYGLTVIGNLDQFIKNNPYSKKLIMGIGDPKMKKKIYDKLKDEQVFWPNIIHPSVRLVKDIRIGKGVVIFPGCIISTNVEIGDFVCINSNSSISHDAVLGEFSTINPGCNINGESMIKKGAYLGSGSIIKDECQVGEWAIVGAGAVVINDIPPDTTVVGIPARPINSEVKK